MSSTEQNTTRGRHMRLLLWLVAAAGLAVWAGVLLRGDAARGWRMLLVNFLFFNSLAAGMVVWSAVVMASRGRWIDSLKRTAAAGIGFMPVSLAVLVVLMFGGRYWIPWWGDTALHNRAWLNVPFMFSRDIIALAVFWLMALVFVRKADKGRPAQLAGWLIFVFCVVFSLLGFDLVMSLDPRWKSSLLGGYFFISSLYIGVAGWTMATILQGGRQTGPARFRDLANLILTFSLLTTYMMYTQLLVPWYENLPGETTFMLPRLNTITAWPSMSVLLLPTVYLGPLVLLLVPGFKTKAPMLGVVAGMVLLFMWVERWWLVMPSLGEPLAFGPAEAGITAASAAGFALCIMEVQRRWPERFAITEAALVSDAVAGQEERQP
jgi:hypothetical protein